MALWLYLPVDPGGRASRRQHLLGNYGSDTISRANLAGGGGGEIPVAGPAPEGPYGMAIDAAAGKLYWINYDSETIEYANLDGTGAALLNTGGATVSQPAGLAIDPPAGRIYWPNNGAQDKISYASLNGSGGGDLNTTGATLSEPYGVAVHPAAGRIYWANFAGGKISYANLDGSGGGNVDTGLFFLEPLGIAVDAAVGKLYWPEYNHKWIAFAALGGGEGGSLEITNAPYGGASGIAIDAPGGRIYWANEYFGSIGLVNAAGGGDTLLDTSGATLESPSFPVLLESPRGTQSPLVSLSGGADLACSQGGWAGDLLESFLYRAPQTFAYQWLRNGAEIAGATTNTLHAGRVGDYSCRVTAANFAGATSQTSSAFSFAAGIRIGRPSLNLRKGTAKLPVSLIGPPGRLVLRGKDVAKRRRTKASGSVRLLVKAKGTARNELAATGRVKVKAKVNYVPAGAESPLKRTRKITLKKRPRR